MKYILLAIVVMLVAVGAAFAATGNKPNQVVMPFRNVSSSTKPANCVRGEVRHNGQYVFNCVSTGKWHRASSGVSF